ncbi:MAG: TIGR02757 family protein [Polyangiaceae bacterium]
MALERVRDACDVTERVTRDPVGVVRRYADPRDREIVALVASSLAFGNVTTIRAKVDEALDRIGPVPSAAHGDPDGVARRLRGFVHRVYKGADLAKLVIGASRVQERHGTMGAFFEARFAESGDLREALVALVAAIREAGGFGARGSRDAAGRPRERGAEHLLPDPSKGSGAKRLLLFLRWMIRPDDGVDLGMWNVPARALLVPVDTHIHKLARNLGFTDASGVTWKAAVEITASLRRLDPEDPAKYDFSLCHLGMLQRCPSRKDPGRCEGCGVLPVCRHWQIVRR